MVQPPLQREVSTSSPRQICRNQIQICMWSCCVFGTWKLNLLRPFPPIRSRFCWALQLAWCIGRIRWRLFSQGFAEGILAGVLARQSTHFVPRLSLSRVLSGWWHFSVLNCFLLAIIAEVRVRLISFCPGCAQSIRLIHVSLSFGFEQKVKALPRISSRQASHPSCDVEDELPP